MAGTKISEATLRSTLKGTEELPIVDTDLPVGKTTTNDLKAFVQPDLSGYAKKADIPSTDGLLSAEEAAETYQPKGNYLTKVPSEYVTESELTKTLNDYETSSHASSTYATKTELSGKVSGIGVTSIQVVTELPSEQQDGVLYIVQEQELSGEETA